MVIIIFFVGRASPTYLSISLFFCFIIWFSYRILFHQLTGQTIGKMVTNIIVLDENEMKLLSRIQCIKREIIPMVIGLVALYLIYEHSLQPKYEYEDMLSSGTTNFQTDTSFSFDRVNRFLDAYEKAKSHENRPSEIIRYSGLIWTAIVCLSILSNSKLRGLHDMIAKSVVVKKEVWERENETTQIKKEDNGSHTS